MSPNDSDKTSRETGSKLSPRFDAGGLITAVVTQAGTGSPLMVAHMTAKALELTIETGEAHFFSRSRNEIWHKGAASGNVLHVTDIRVDCDQDCVWLSVELTGPGAACHTGRKTCFYRRITDSGGLEMTEDDPLFDPEQVYGR